MLLKQLTDLNGLPGCEDSVRDFIKEQIKDYVDEMYTDRLGNLIAVKNKDAKGKHMAVSAHMDEAGLVVRLIDKSGLIKFGSWGVDPRVVVSKIVRIGKNKIPGVIGSKPIHLQKPDERKVALTLKDLYIDIGSDSKEETEKLVSVGDYVAFDGEWTEFGENNNKVKAKALDDRCGCAAIIEALKSDTKYKITALFVTQEEVGIRGSKVAANQVFADIVVNLEGTVNGEAPEVPEHLHVTTQGAGPAISLKDSASIFFKKYVDMMVACAEKHNIPYQFRRASFGGTDSANYHVAHGGTPVINVAVPCRYIHSPVSTMDKRDFENMVILLQKFIAYYNEEVTQ